MHCTLASSSWCSRSRWQRLTLLVQHWCDKFQWIVREGEQLGLFLGCNTGEYERCALVIAKIYWTCNAHVHLQLQPFISFANVRTVHLKHGCTSTHAPFFCFSQSLRTSWSALAGSNQLRTGTTPTIDIPLCACSALLRIYLAPRVAAPSSPVANVEQRRAGHSKQMSSSCSLELLYFTLRDSDAF